MNIILFGPPGIGKSTLIGALKAIGYRAIDLEDMYPSRIRFQIPANVNDVFIGAADLNPRRKYSNSIKVLLHLDQTAYDQRRAARDAKDPSKANQTVQKVDDWLKGTQYHTVLDVSDANKAIAKLQQLAKSYFKRDVRKR